MIFFNITHVNRTIPSFCFAYVIPYILIASEMIKYFNTKFINTYVLQIHQENYDGV